MVKHALTRYLVFGTMCLGSESLMCNPVKQDTVAFSLTPDAVIDSAIVLASVPLIGKIILAKRKKTFDWAAVIGIGCLMGLRRESLYKTAIGLYKSIPGDGTFLDTFTQNPVDGSLKIGLALAGIYVVGSLVKSCWEGLTVKISVNFKPLNLRLKK